MRKYFIVMMMSVMAVTTAGVWAQSHRHTPRTQTATEVTVRDTAVAGNAAVPQAEKATVKEPVKKQENGRKGKTEAQSVKRSAYQPPKDDTADEDGGIEAYSDTASVYAADTTSGYSYQYDFTNGALDKVFSGLSWLTGGVMASALILIFLFLFAPIAVLALLFYFIYKSRKQKLKLAEMAIQSGQPMPEQLLKPTAVSDDELWRKGIRNVFLGVGLIVLFFFMDIDTGIGVGFLVAIYGAGQAVIARTSASKRERGGDNGGADGDPQETL